MHANFTYFLTHTIKQIVFQFPPKLQASRGIQEEEGKGEREGERAAEPVSGGRKRTGGEEWS